MVGKLIGFWWNFKALEKSALSGLGVTSSLNFGAEPH